MAFFIKVGNILKQTVNKQVTSKFSATNPSIYQALRCMSSSKLFIGGLPWAMDDSTLREAFSSYGEVVEAKVIFDRESNRSKGFGFVTFSSTEEASSAIQAMDGQDLNGRRVRVDYATERAPRPGGFGGGGGYGGGGFGGGGYGGGGYGGSGGYGGGQNYGGSNSGGYSGGAAAGGQYGSGGGGYGGAGASFGGSGGGNYAGGVGGSDFLGGGSSSTNASSETGFASSGFEQGSGLGHDESIATDAAPDSNEGVFDPSEPVEENFRDDDQPDDFAKRA